MAHGTEESGHGAAVVFDTAPSPVRPRVTLSAWRAEIGVGTALVVLIVLLSLVAKNFFSLHNFASLLTRTSVIAIVAVGMTMVIIGGEINLSVGSTVGLSGAIFAWLIVKYGFSKPFAFIAVAALAVAIGVSIGILREVWAIPSSITTIGLLSALRGAAFLVTEGVSIGRMPKDLEALWYGELLGLPVPIILAAAAAFVGSLVLKHTRTGSDLYAVGGSAETSAASKSGGYALASSSSFSSWRCSRASCWLPG